MTIVKAHDNSQVIDYCYDKGQKNAKGQTICGSRRNRNPLPCQSTKVMKNGRCKNHGGKSLRGIEHPNYTHGRTSRYAPQRYLEKFQDLLGSPELLNLAPDIALLDVRTNELLEMIDKSDPSLIQIDLMNSWSNLEKAYRSGDELDSYIQDHSRALSAISTYSQAWSDIQDVLEQRRRTAVSYHKMLIDEGQMVSMPEIMMFVARFVELVRENIEDREVRARISAGLSQLIAG